jgi:molybdopterin converting factor subunit 1
VVRVRVRFFAALRERAGSAAAERSLTSPLTVGELWDVLRAEHPRLADYAGKIAFAVNQQYVDSKTTLQDNDEVAFIPPVSGGSQRQRNV